MHDAAVVCEGHRVGETVELKPEATLCPGQPRQLAVEAIGPQVIGAGEAARVALFLGAQDVAAMAAGIDEAPDHAVLAAHDQVGLVEQRIDLPVAALGKFVGTPDDLPDLAPDLLALAFLNLRRGVAVGTDPPVER